MKKLLITIISVSLFVAAHAQSNQNSEYRKFEITKNLSVFNTILRELDANYVDTLKYDELVKTGINNMLMKLDPYTVYMPEEMNDDLKMNDAEFQKTMVQGIANGIDSYFAS